MKYYLRCLGRLGLVLMIAGAFEALYHQNLGEYESLSIVFGGMFYTFLGGPLDE